ncbi:MAG: outer membrane beta-barrel protein [Saprospiraceae bacterium]|nr:outer membrane beta-barrel protein [Saprospiraceae bacterium]
MQILNIYVGNPSLRPEYVHSFNTSYFSLQQFFFYFYFRQSWIQLCRNRITDLIEVDSLSSHHTAYKCER